MEEYSGGGLTIELEDAINEEGNHALNARAWARSHRLAPRAGRIGLGLRVPGQEVHAWITVEDAIAIGVGLIQEASKIKAAADG
jgi:hypothetical protein